MSAKKPSRPKRLAKPPLLAPALAARLADLYSRMQEAYATAAQAIGLSCQACADNCCVSFFQHHTHVEWAYLWQGLSALPEDRRAAYLQRAEDYLRQARFLLAQGLRPRLMCPVNDNGLCGIYAHRLMICRLHGVPNVLRRPDGREIAFPGCEPCQGLTQGLAKGQEAAPVLDRTPFYTELAALEMELLGARPRALSRVDLTLAEMLVLGPPKL